MESRLLLSLLGERDLGMGIISVGSGKRALLETSSEGIGPASERLMSEPNSYSLFGGGLAADFLFGEALMGEFFFGGLS